MNLLLTLKVPSDGLVVPALQTTTVAMSQQSTVGPYNLYIATYALDSAQSQTAKFDVSIGSGSSQVADGFKNVSDLPSICAAMSRNVSSTVSSSTSIPSSSSAVNSTR